jgi:hypothetical protein
MATVSQMLGISEVSITYSRPSVHGRTIWGEVVPWGQIWRTGANEAATITFTDDVKVEGQELAAGTYGLFTIPDQEEWTVIFNSVAEQWGSFNYNRDLDSLRIKVKPRKAPHQETFQIDIPEIGSDTLVIRLRWEEVEVPFTVQAEVAKIAIGKAREFVASATPADSRMVWNWANYFYHNEYNTLEALTWASKLAEQAPIYWTHALHARLLAQNGRPAEALEEAEKALERAKEETGQTSVTADSQKLAGEMKDWKEQSAANRGAAESRS